MVEKRIRMAVTIEVNIFLDKVCSNLCVYASEGFCDLFRAEIHPHKWPNGKFSGYTRCSQCIRAEATK